MIRQTIFSGDGREWLIFGRDPERPAHLADANHVLVTDGAEGLLIDPGGIETFPALLAAVSETFPIDAIGRIFLSHQDPDAASSLPLWRRVGEGDVRVLVSAIWAGAIAHLDARAVVEGVPDRGADIPLGDGPPLRAIPAHYLHSPGNFHLYDPLARILFTGDVGAAELPGGAAGGFVVEDFARHTEFMAPFHRRWMPSREARDAWLRNVAHLRIDALAPQRGLIFRGGDVGRFLDWFSGLQLGSAVQVMAPEPGPVPDMGNLQAQTAPPAAPGAADAGDTAAELPDAQDAPEDGNDPDDPEAPDAPEDGTVTGGG